MAAHGERNWAGSRTGKRVARYECLRPLVGCTSAGLSIFDAHTREKSSVCGGGGIDVIAGLRNQHRDVQRGERSATETAPFAGA